MKKMINYIFSVLSRKHKVWICLFVLFCIISGMCGILVPFFSGTLIDSLIIAEGRNALMSFCYLIGAVAFIGIVINYFSRYVYTIIFNETVHLINIDMVNHIHRLPLSFWLERAPAYVSQRIYSDVTSIVSFIINFIPNAISNFVVFISISFVLSQLHLKIYVFMIITLAVFPIIFFLLRKPLLKLSRKQKEANSYYFSLLNEQLEKSKFIKSHSLHAYFFKKFTAGFDSLLLAAIKYFKTSSILSVSETAITTTMTIIIFIIGGDAVISKQMTVGELTIVLSYFRILQSAANYFLSVTKDYVEAKAAYHRLLEILSMPKQHDGSIKHNQVNYVRLQDVCFTYQNANLEFRYTLEFDAGKKYCITGANGAGKSTLCEILLGLHVDEYSGVLTINGENIKNLDMEYFRENNIGLAEQIPVICQDSILNNILLLRQKDYDSIKLKDIVARFGLNDLLNEGLKSRRKVIDGIHDTLSGGEKQKIGIARLLMQSPDIMIFDEPTSFLDDKSTQTFLKIIEEYAEDKIVIIVSHDDRVISQINDVINLSN